LLQLLRARRCPHAPVVLGWQARLLVVVVVVLVLVHAV
jgi:hypothetical protein